MMNEASTFNRTIPSHVIRPETDDAITVKGIIKPKQNEYMLIASKYNAWAKGQTIEAAMNQLLTETKQRILLRECSVYEVSDDYMTDVRGAQHVSGQLSRVAGVVFKPLDDNRIVIRTASGKEHSYEVRSLIQPKLATLCKCDAAVLLVDEENKVIDVSR
ncbi:MAG: hypothetical protein QM771_15315 [Nitrospira sp.]